MVKLILIALFIFVATLHLADGKLQEYYMTSLCSGQKTAVKHEIPGPSAGLRSSGILRASKYPAESYYEGKTCTVTLVPPSGYGVVASIRTTDLRQNKTDILMIRYEKIFISKISVSEKKWENILSWQDKKVDKKETWSYFSISSLNVTFQTGVGSTNGYEGFELIYTVAKEVGLFPLIGECADKEFRCFNSRCISDVFNCDGHNHCGDRSDQAYCEI